MLHGYRQFMLKDFWFSSKMNETLFLFFLADKIKFFSDLNKNVSDKLNIKG